MPAGLLPSEGIAELLTYMLSAEVTGVLPWELLLWTNDIAVDEATVLADLVEATFTGYSRQTLDRDQWQAPVLTGNCAQSSWDTVPIEWFVGAALGETLYGYAMVDTTAGVLRFVQRFDDADIEPLETGGRVLLMPLFTLTSGVCL